MTRKPINFLLVEDDDDHATLVLRHLRRMNGSNVLHRARDGADALAFLRREGAFSASPRPDVILLDVNLPKYNGLEVLAAIKDDPDLTRVPVVMLTTSTAEADRSKARQLHADRYLVKPLDNRQFSKLIAEFCRERAELNSTAPGQ